MCGSPGKPIICHCDWILMISLTSSVRWSLTDEYWKSITWSWLKLNPMWFSAVVAHLSFTVPFLSDQTSLAIFFWPLSSMSRFQKQPILEYKDNIFPTLMFEVNILRSFLPVYIIVNILYILFGCTGATTWLIGYLYEWADVPI